MIFPTVVTSEELKCSPKCHCQIYTSTVTSLSLVLGEKIKFHLTLSFSVVCRLRKISFSIISMWTLSAAKRNGFLPFWKSVTNSNIIPHLLNTQDNWQSGEHFEKGKEAKAVILAMAFWTLLRGRSAQPLSLQTRPSSEFLYQTPTAQNHFHGGREVRLNMALPKHLGRPHLTARQDSF